MSLRDLREAAGFKTSRSFAEYVGMTATSYSRYETDPSHMPLRAAWRIADVLRCPIDKVVGRRVPRRDTEDLNELRESFPLEIQQRLDEYIGFLKILESIQTDK